MSEEGELVRDVDQVVENITRLNTWVAANPGDWDTSIRSVRRWYAAWSGSRWRFGFSKFIGYAGMTPQYYDEHRLRLDGGETEGLSSLQHMSISVDPGIQLHETLSVELQAFLTTQRRESPRPDHSIRVLLTSPASPQDFVISQECQMAAWQNGFRRPSGEADGWACYGSTTAKGKVWLAAVTQDGPWYLALDHAGVIDEIGQADVGLAGPGKARFACASLTELYALLSRVYQLGISLPDGPLEEFHGAVQGLPTTTEAERLVIQRVGQGIFRDRLMTYWQGRCPLTGISDPALLRASHIISWKDCTTDAERLDVHNGLLLSALWDAAFDRGLVTFGDGGIPKFSPNLSEAARSELRWQAPLPLTDQHRSRLAWHQANAFLIGTEIQLATGTF